MLSGYRCTETMFNADVLQKGLWACEIVLQAALLVKIVERNLLFGLRWFVAWLAAEVAFAILLIWTPISSVMYFHVWSVAQPLLCILRIAAGWEVVRRIVNIRLGPRFTRYHALAAGILLSSLALSVFSLRVETSLFHCSVWTYSIVLLNRSVWTSIAIVATALFVTRRLRPAWPFDRNTMAHASLLFALSVVETGRYLTVAYGHGRYNVAANVAAFVMECLLFALWMVWLKPEEEAQAIQDDEWPLAA
jgi:hypothetical protein